MTLRLLSLHDTAWMDILHRSSFEPPQCWDASFFSTLLSQQGSIGLAHIDAGTPTAFVLARIAAETGEILTIATNPAKRRSGIAYALMQELLVYFDKKNAQDIFLEVAVNNDAAIALYEKLGFEKTAVRKNYYKQPPHSLDAFLDCHVMRKRNHQTKISGL